MALTSKIFRSIITLSSHASITIPKVIVDITKEIMKAYDGSKKVSLTFNDEIFKGCFTALLSMAYGPRPKINLSVMNIDILSKASQEGHWPKVWPETIPSIGGAPGVRHDGTFVVPFTSSFEPLDFIRAINGLVKTIKQET